MTVFSSTTQSSAPGFLAWAEAPGTRPSSSQSEMDAALSILHAYKGPWARLALNERITILDQILEDLCAVREEWIRAGLRAREVQGNHVAEAEEWAMLGSVFRLVSLLGQSLRDIRQTGRPQFPGPVGERAGGQVTVQVYPIRRFDRLFLQSTTAEVWMQPGVSDAEMVQRQARFYQTAQSGAGFAWCSGREMPWRAPAADVLYKLFVEGQVVMLKMNPVNDYMGPILTGRSAN